MNRTILSAAALLVVTSVASADPMTDGMSGGSAPAFSGSVGARIGVISASNGTDSQTVTLYGADAKFNYAFDQRWNAQTGFDFSGASSDGSTVNSYSASEHVFWRDPAAYAVGGFGTFSIIDPDGGDAVYSVRGGPEFQLYRGNMTYYGQAFAGWFGNDSGDATAWGVRGEARYFHTENLRFEGELGFSQLSQGGDTVNVITAGLEAEKRLDNSPLSFYGRYQLDHISPTGEDAVVAHTFLVGIRASFGVGTLFDEDRHGATMEEPKTTQFF